MGDGIALTDLGQTLTSGERAYGCPHMAQWWPVFPRLQILRGRIKACLDIVQAYGWSDKSGGTHGQGTAVDVTQTDAGIVADAREAGARGTWCRGKRWGQASMGDHIHLALDCPCASGSDYQIGAADDGYNGLGYLGRGGRDYHPAPKVRRDWKAGIAWMQGAAFAWALGGVLSVITSMVYLSGKSLTFLSSEIGFAALPVALLAGLESIGGLLLAGIIVGVVQGLTAAYIDPLIGGNAAAVVPYIFMLVVLIVRPTGMFGWKRIERV